MLTIQVKYFFNEKGIAYFSIWFDENKRLSSMQKGYIDMHMRMEGDSPVITLYFDNHKNLKKWTATKTHNDLLAKINTHFTQSKNVDIKEIDPV